jgi:hypothetical protein
MKLSELKQLRPDIYLIFKKAVKKAHGRLDWVESKNRDEHLSMALNFETSWLEKGFRAIDQENDFGVIDNLLSSVGVQQEMTLDRLRTISPFLYKKFLGYVVEESGVDVMIDRLSRDLSLSYCVIFNPRMVLGMSFWYRVSSYRGSTEKFYDSLLLGNSARVTAKNEDQIPDVDDEVIIVGIDDLEKTGEVIIETKKGFRDTLSINNLKLL